jgi:hypothetical protein
MTRPLPRDHPNSRAANTRSSVTNGKRLFTHAPSSQAWLRRLRDLLDLHIADLGGENIVSTAEHSICRRIATVTVELEIMERRFATKGKGASERDLDLYLRGANSLRRLLEAIGLKRVARDVTPLLQDYLAQQSTKDVDPADVEEVLPDEASP